MERMFNGALAVSVCSWAVLGLLNAPSLSLVHISTAVLNFCVAVLLLFRESERTAAKLSSLVFALPAFLIGGLASFLAPTGQFWTWPLQGLFAFGTGLTIISLASLGRSFAFLPGIRSIIHRGPYRLIRHPAYLGELIMIGCCNFALATWWSLLIFLVTIITLIVRIRVEEHELSQIREYQQYQNFVRWRLIPGLW